MRYQAGIKFNLPANDGWRTAARKKDVTLWEETPDGLFQAMVKLTISTLFEEQEQGEIDGLSFGLLLNLLQQFPVDVRRAMVAAIASGQIMKLKKTWDGQILVDSAIAVAGFAIDLSEEADIRPSGLVVPSGAPLVAVPPTV